MSKPEEEQTLRERICTELNHHPFGMRFEDLCGKLEEEYAEAEIKEELERMETNGEANYKNGKWNWKGSL